MPNFSGLFVSPCGNPDLSGCENLSGSNVDFAVIFKDIFVRLSYWVASKAEEVPAWMLVLEIAFCITQGYQLFWRAWDRRVSQVVGHSVLELGKSQKNQEELVTLIIAGGLTKLQKRNSCSGTEVCRNIS